MSIVERVVNLKTRRRNPAKTLPKPTWRRKATVLSFCFGVLVRKQRQDAKKVRPLEPRCRFTWS